MGSEGPHVVLQFSLPVLVNQGTPPVKIQRLLEAGTLYYAVVLPARRSGFRAGSRRDSSREGIEFGPPAGLPARTFSYYPARKSVF